MRTLYLFNMKLMTETNAKLLNLSLLLLRCTTGAILFGVGAGKVFGWFGGNGLEHTIHIFVTKAHIPALLAYVSTFTEFIGGLLLIAGFLTRPAAFAVMINMTVATIKTLPNGFLVGGAAFPFTLMVSAAVILMTGPMAYSIDSLLHSSQAIHEPQEGREEPESKVK